MELNIEGRVVEARDMGGSRWGRDIYRKGTYECKGVQAHESVGVWHAQDEKNQVQRKALSTEYLRLEMLEIGGGLWPHRVRFPEKAFGICPEALMGNP